MTVFNQGYRKAGRVPMGQDSLTGLVVAVLREAYEGKAHGAIPLLPQDRLWSYDHESRERIASGSGAPIHGRQDFPDVLESDGSFAIGKASWFHQYLNHSDSRGVLPFEIEDQETFKIHSAVDIFRSKLCMTSSNMNNFAKIRSEVAGQPLTA
jgi:hypothetical protein